MTLTAARIDSATSARASVPVALLDFIRVFFGNELGRKINHVIQRAHFAIGHEAGFDRDNYSAVKVRVLVNELGVGFELVVAVASDAGTVIFDLMDDIPGRRTAPVNCLVAGLHANVAAVFASPLLLGQSDGGGDPDEGECRAGEHLRLVVHGFGEGRDSLSL